MCFELFESFRFLVAAPQLLWWYPEQHLSSSTHYHFLSRGNSVSYGFWKLVGQNSWTEILSWAERFMSIPKTSWINLQFKKEVYSSQHSWQLICFVYWKHCIGIALSAAVIYFNKCLPVLFGELHWVTPILSCFSTSEQGGTQDQAFTMLLRYSL